MCTNKERRSKEIENYNVSGREEKSTNTNGETEPFKSLCAVEKRLKSGDQGDCGWDAEENGRFRKFQFMVSVWGYNGQCHHTVTHIQVDQWLFDILESNTKTRI